MAPHSETLEAEVNVAPGRLWKAIKDVPKLGPKLLPQVFQSFVDVEGTGGPGTVREVTLKNPVTGEVVTNREVIDVVDEEKHKFVYHVEEGDLKKLYRSYKLTAVILPGEDAGKSKVLYTIEREAEGELPPSVNDEHKAGFYGLSKALEAFLLANEADYA